METTTMWCCDCNARLSVPVSPMSTAADPCPNCGSVCRASASNLVSSAMLPPQANALTGDGARHLRVVPNE